MLQDEVWYRVLAARPGLYLRIGSMVVKKSIVLPTNDHPDPETPS